MATRPSLRKRTPSIATESPEDLFVSLPGRAKTHGYLRGPQQDVLREYLKHHTLKDIAFELPTGTGKTLVGLLIAEWQRRRSGQRAAYLTLTNQLAAQVLEEAKKLNVQVADLRGSRDRRDALEEGRFLDGSAIGVSTYANLFNVNPIIKQCGVLVLDDAHGGSEFAASMWTVRITAEDHPEVLGDLQAILRPLMTEAQIAEIFSSAGSSHIAMVDLGCSLPVKDDVMRVLGGIEKYTSADFAWGLVKTHLNACHVFVAKDCVTVRPYVTPTYDHLPFDEAQQRIYLSATLGDLEDLCRAYALTQVQPIRAQSEQEGRRYVFVPGLAMGDDQVEVALAEIWKRLVPQRALAIAPSFPALQSLKDELEKSLSAASPAFYSARDVEESLTPFVSKDGAILALANRYDGLDLPDDDCRLLILFESPRTTNELETNLSVSWKLGAALRWREATRLVQGMGRCTRNATDFAVILLLGQSLINAVTNPNLLHLLPANLRREIEWGRQQIKDVFGSPSSFAEMAIGLVSDASYRNDADEAIGIPDTVSGDTSAIAPASIAANEVVHSRAIWSGDYTRAFEIACAIADSLHGPDWVGIRAWWRYLASLAARYSENTKGEIDALRRAKGTGINSGWLDHVIRTRQKLLGATSAPDDDATSTAVGEAIWNALESLGWSGKKFHEFCDSLKANIGNTADHTKFHEGIEALGKLLGASSSRPTGDGEPDVIWKFNGRLWICFEAKANKRQGGQGIAKRDMLEARGHVDWVRYSETSNSSEVEIIACIVAPDKKIHPIASPYRGSLSFISNDEMASWAADAIASAMELRTKYAGHDYASECQQFSLDAERAKLDLASTRRRLSVPL